MGKVTAATSGKFFFVIVFYNRKSEQLYECRFLFCLADSHSRPNK